MFDFADALVRSKHRFRASLGRSYCKAKNETKVRFLFSSFFFFHAGRVVLQPAFPGNFEFLQDVCAEAKRGGHVWNETWLGRSARFGKSARVVRRKLKTSF